MRLSMLVMATALVGCAMPEVAPPSAPGGLSELLERPAERALYDALRAYDDGQYVQAESALQASLAAGPRSPRDRAMAHKLLAFIHCTSARVDACEAAFRAARDADKSFALSRSEAGHPTWGPVYRRVISQPSAPPSTTPTTRLIAPKNTAPTTP